MPDKDAGNASPAGQWVFPPENPSADRGRRTIDPIGAGECSRLCLSPGLQQGNIAARGEAITKAISIIESGLQQSLNKDVGGDIAARLDALYTYMAHRLLEANVRQSEEVLVEIDGLLATLEEAWMAIAPDAAKMAAA